MKLALDLAPRPPLAQPEQSRVANVTIPKSRVLASQVLRILSRNGFTGVVSFENFLIIFSYCLSYYAIGYIGRWGILASTKLSAKTSPPVPQGGIVGCFDDFILLDLP